MIQGPQLIIVLAIILLLFGGSKLPKLARSLGQAQKEFRDGLKEGQEEDDEPAKPANAATDTPPPVADTPKPATTPADTSPDDDDTRRES